MVMSILKQAENHTNGCKITGSRVEAKDLLRFGVLLRFFFTLLSRVVYLGRYRGCHLPIDR